MYWARFLILTCLLLFLGVELGARLGLPRLSQIERRVSRELQEVYSLQDDRAILLLGNSLLGTGVDLKVLASQLGDERPILRLYIENTRYLDRKSVV